MLKGEKLLLTTRRVIHDEAYNVGLDVDERVPRMWYFEKRVRNKS